MIQTMTRALSVPALILGASAAILGAAFAIQFLGGADPCLLCVYQRYPYGVAIVLSALALVLARGSRAQPRLLGLCGAAFLASAGLASFHLGVEQHWWAGTAACAAGTGGAATTVVELKAMVASALRPRCDEVAWSLFGVSLAGYNLLASLALASLSLWAARAMRGRKTAARGYRQA